MSPSELAEIFDTNPNSPFRVTLSNGDTVLVDKPLRTRIEPVVLYVGQADDPGPRVAQRTRIVSIPNVAMLERIEPQSLRSGRRR